MKPFEEYTELVKALINHWGTPHAEAEEEAKIQARMEALWDQMTNAERKQALRDDIRINVRTGRCATKLGGVLKTYLELEKVLLATDSDLTEAEEDKIRDEMDVLWMLLTDAERTKLQNEPLAEAK